MPCLRPPRVLQVVALVYAVLSEWSVVARTQDWPRFLHPLQNITVPVGREATFTCHIANLGPHKVAWIKSENQGILSINERVISDTERLSVVRNDVNTWTMTLRGVRRDDSGSYMCQVNTVPVRVQVGVLEVVVPPDIISSDTSGDVDVPEGGSARLECRVRGHPQPTVSWIREDGGDIVLRHGRQIRGHTFSGQVLHLANIARTDMGVYLCIASNGIPPVVSKRIMVSVHFAPSVSAVNGLISTPLDSEVTLTCHVEASPKPVYYWATPNPGDMLPSGPRHHLVYRQLSSYRHQMSLTISGVTAADFRPYLCVAKNPVGEAVDRIDLHEIVLPVHASGDRRRKQQQQQTHHQQQERRYEQHRQQQQQQRQQSLDSQQQDPWSADPAPDGGDGPSRRRGARLPPGPPPELDRGRATACRPELATLPPLLMVSLGVRRVL
ncbi:lachesin-like [Amphibalanus amphitrite]|uniref:lachesin-like n=1 Tax=Amphibalanus amphitrite TaxID=1232801 RepID=UPI001C926E68|nr:lachesin-like [Amphibalanus amphitrite]